MAKVLNFREGEYENRKWAKITLIDEKQDTADKFGYFPYEVKIKYDLFEKNQIHIMEDIENGTSVSVRYDRFGRVVEYMSGV